MSAQIKTSMEEANRYTRHSILRSEQMYGNGFQSPGNVAIVESFCQRLNLEPKIKILDIGSGLGGASFYFAENYDATVIGLDVAPAMIEISNERKTAKGLNKVEFLLGDIRDISLKENDFDLAWTRDCILYVPEKKQVWQQVFRYLKPGGKLFITDFCSKDSELSQSFNDYLKQCSYYLQSIANYSKTLSEVGFQVLAQEDITEMFISCLQKELDNLLANKDKFLSEFAQEDYQYLNERWKKKINFCKEGDFRWGLFIAEKPLN